MTPYLILFKIKIDRLAMAGVLSDIVRAAIDAQATVPVRSESEHGYRKAGIYEAFGRICDSQVKTWAVS